MIPGYDARRNYLTCPVCLFEIEAEILPMHRRTCDIVAAYLQWELVAFLEDPVGFGR